MKIKVEKPMITRVRMKMTILFSSKENKGPIKEKENLRERSIRREREKGKGKKKEQHERGKGEE